MRYSTIEFLLLSQVGALFINYLADVLPETRSFSRPKWWPLNGKSLQAYFSTPRVLIVQFVFVLLAIWLQKISIPGWSPHILLFIMLYFGLVMIIDIEHRAILHPISLVGAVIFLAFRTGADGFINSLVGGAAGFGILLFIYWLGNHLVQWMAKRKGAALEDSALGFGDVILAGVIGLLLGWPGVVAGLFLGMLLAGIYSAIHILWQLVRGNYQAFTSIPLGPFVFLGAFAAILLRAYA